MNDTPSPDPSASVAARGGGRAASPDQPWARIGLGLGLAASVWLGLLFDAGATQAVTQVLRGVIERDPGALVVGGAALLVSHGAVLALARAPRGLLLVAVAALVLVGLRPDLARVALAGTLLAHAALTGDRPRHHLASVGLGLVLGHAAAPWATAGLALVGLPPATDAMVHAQKAAQVDEGRIAYVEGIGLVDRWHVRATLGRRDDALAFLARERAADDEHRPMLDFNAALGPPLIWRPRLRLASEPGPIERRACADGLALALAEYEERQQRRAPLRSGARLSADAREDRVSAFFALTHRDPLGAMQVGPENHRRVAAWPRRGADKRLGFLPDGATALQRRRFQMMRAAAAQCWRSMDDDGAWLRELRATDDDDPGSRSLPAGASRLKRQKPQPKQR